MTTERAKPTLRSAQSAGLAHGQWSWVFVSLLLIFGTWSWVGCWGGEDGPDPTRSLAESEQGLIWEAANFAWRPPISNRTTPMGTFDSSLDVRVEVCEGIPDGSDPCPGEHWNFNRTSGAMGEVVRVQDGQYHLNFHARDFGLDLLTVYRIRVFANGIPVGIADLLPVSNGRELKNLNTNEIVGLINDRTLPIKFHIATGVTPGQPPTVNATYEPDPVYVGGTVTVHANATDPDGDQLTYLWTFLAYPGTEPVLVDSTMADASFFVAQAGSYSVQVIVSDGVYNVTGQVGFETENRPPMADAGADQTAPNGATVTLNGGGSSDPDGDPLSFSWSFTSQPPESNATLSDPSAVNPTFMIDVSGNYELELEVSDGQLSDFDTVAVSTENSPPVANAGPDQSAMVTQTVVLDGSASSDVDGDPLTFLWTLVSQPAMSGAFLNDPTSVAPSITIDKPGTYIVELVVNDGMADSAPDEMAISTMNSPPVADAGPDQSAYVGDEVTLDGSNSSDVDGDPLTFFWSLTVVPNGSVAALDDPTAVNPHFSIDLPGTYTAQLIVNDGTVDSDADTVAITTLNSPPVADAGLDQSVALGALVHLDGSGSSDADGDQLTYSWSLISTPQNSAATLSDPSAENPMFTADLAGTYVAQLIVNDGTVNSQPDTATISTLNTAPVANAGPNQTVAVGSTVNLTGTGSFDADGDQLTYSWSFTSQPPGSAATLSGATMANPSFVAAVAGTYVVQLIVYDGAVFSNPATVTITATPPLPPNPTACGTVICTLPYIYWPLPVRCTLVSVNNGVVNYVDSGGRTWVGQPVVYYDWRGTSQAVFEYYIGHLPQQVSNATLTFTYLTRRGSSQWMFLAPIWPSDGVVDISDFRLPLNQPESWQSPLDPGLKMSDSPAGSYETTAIGVSTYNVTSRIQAARTAGADRIAFNLDFRYDTGRQVMQFANCNAAQLDIVTP